MKVKLKPCPFCGSKKVKYYSGWKKGKRKYDQKAEGRSPSICCSLCGIGFRHGWFGHGISDKKAELQTKEAWNTRADE